MLKGIVFDLDGVICSTDEYHYKAWKALADSMDIPFDRETNNLLRGVSRMASLDIILDNGNAADRFSLAEKESLAEQKNELYKLSLNDMKPDDLNPQVRKTLDILREMGLLLAIGSSSKNAPLILSRIGLGRYFDAVVDGNQIVHSKPDPEVFEKAVQDLELYPAEALVVEDAVSGALAGHGAGMQVICLGDAAAKKAGDWNIASFGEIANIAESLLS